jgi:hypothetical protein
MYVKQMRISYAFTFLEHITPFTPIFRLWYLVTLSAFAKFELTAPTDTHTAALKSPVCRHMAGMHYALYKHCTV